MNFFRIVLISILFIFTSNLAMADNHTKEQDIIDILRSHGGNLSGNSSGGNSSGGGSSSDIVTS